MFEIVIAVMVQNAFRLEMHQNDNFFYFLKIIFKISTSKQFENIKQNNFLQKKLKFEGTGFSRVPKHALNVSLNFIFYILSYFKKNYLNILILNLKIILF
jgi:hypothetical protein